MAESDRGEPEAAGRHDINFKQLITDFPARTVEWLLPQAIEAYGAITHVELLRQESQRHWLSDTGREVDVALKCTFERGRLIIALIEHQSSKRHFSIHKLAHYTLDLMEREPEIAVVPIVIFADGARNWRKDVPRQLDNTAFGHSWLSFRYEFMRLKAHPAREMIESDNPVVQVLIGNFDLEPQEKLALITRACLNLHRLVHAKAFVKYLDFLQYYAKLSKDEEERWLQALNQEENEMRSVSQLLIERGREQGIEQGIERGVERGREEGRLVGRIQAYQRIFQLPITPEADLARQPLEQLEALAADLERRAFP